jgi:hypothetical protein
METVASTLSVLPSTPEQLNSFAVKLKSEIENGQIDPLQLRVVKAYLDKVFEKVKPTLDEYARTEAEKHGKNFTYSGASVELAEVGTKYDFTNCNDQEWVELKEAAEKAANKLKERETFLKAIKEPTPIVSKEGEVITLNPPIKTSTSSIKISIK